MKILKKFFTILTLLSPQNFVVAMERSPIGVETKKQETQKNKLEIAKEFINKNPKAAIAIAITTILVVGGGIRLGVYRGTKGDWPWRIKNIDYNKARNAYIKGLFKKA